MFSKIIAVFALVAAVTASPAGTTEKHGSDITAIDASKQCNAGEKLKCCNSEGLNLLDIQCVDIPIIAIPLTNKCNAQANCCKEVVQNGLVNLACVPITL